MKRPLWPLSWRGTIIVINLVFVIVVLAALWRKCG